MVPAVTIAVILVSPPFFSGAGSGLISSFRLYQANGVRKTILSMLAKLLRFWCIEWAATLCSASLLPG